MIPFILLLISSILLIYEINKRNNRIGTTTTVVMQRQENAKSLHKTVVFIAILFIVMTFPGAFVTSFMNSFLQSSGNEGNLVINLCDCFTFSFHALNFIVLYFTNKKFSKEVRIFFKIDNAADRNAATNEIPLNNRIMN